MTLKEFVRKQGLTWNEWLRLDEETQKKWREVQARKNREEQIAANKAYKEYLENCKKEEAAMELLAEIGVPFSGPGCPLGIGWDD